MPRKAPTQVIEHRISFSDYERRELKDAINSYQADKVLENVPNFIISGAAVGAVAIGAYVAYNIYNLIPNLFETDNEQQGAMTWLASWAGFGGAFDNYVKKEWKNFGIPMNMAQIPPQYAINQKVIADKLEKAKGTVKLTDKAGFAGTFGAFAIVNATAQKYIDEGHAKQLQDLEEWKLYYIDYYENNPPKMEESKKK